MNTSFTHHASLPPLRRYISTGLYKLGSPSKKLRYSPSKLPSNHGVTNHCTTSRPLPTTSSSTSLPPSSPSATATATATSIPESSNTAYINTPDSLYLQIEASTEHPSPFTEQQHLNEQRLNDDAVTIHKFQTESVPEVQPVVTTRHKDGSYPVVELEINRVHRDGLGLKLCGPQPFKGVYVAGLRSKGGALDVVGADGQVVMRPGIRILTINGVDVENETKAFAYAVLKDYYGKTVTFTARFDPHGFSFYDKGALYKQHRFKFL